MTNTNILSNPYDQIGQAHNYGLDFVIKKLDVKKPTVQSIVNLTSQYIQQVTNSPQKNNYLLFYEFVGKQINFNNSVDFIEFLKKYTHQQSEKLPLSVESVSFIERILTGSPSFD